MVSGRSGRRKMPDQTESWEVTGNCHAWFDGLLVDHQLIVIPTQAEVHCPITDVDLILDKCGLLEVGPFP